MPITNYPLSGLPSEDSDEFPRIIYRDLERIISEVEASTPANIDTTPSEVGHALDESSTTLNVSAIAHSSRSTMPPPGSGGVNIITLDNGGALLQVYAQRTVLDADLFRRFREEESYRNETLWGIYERYLQQIQESGTAMRQFEELNVNTFRYQIRPDRSDPEAHYQHRQQRRENQERQEAQRNEEIMENISYDSIRIINRNLPEDRQFDTVCNWCSSGIRTKEKDSYLEMEGNRLCRNCWSDNFRRCQTCEDINYIGHMVTDTDGDMFCAKCAKDMARCAAKGCDTLVDSDEYEIDGEIYCEQCHTELTYDDLDWENYGDIRFMGYSTRINDDYCSQNTGDILKSTRIFSAEIEVPGPDNTIYVNRVLKGFPGLGLTTDGSVSGRGLEFQTPKLQGKNGEEFIKNLSAAITKNKFPKTDKTCGLHIHLDGGTEFIPIKDVNWSRTHNGTLVKNLFMLYYVFEDVLQSFLPRSRRTNTYCKSLRDLYHLNEISGAYQLEDLERIWYRQQNRRQVMSSKRSSKHSTRYAGINFHTLFSENHLEIRFHSGTTNAKKIMEWVNLHCLMLDAIAQGSINQSKIMSVKHITNLDEKTEELFNMLNLVPSSRRYFIKRQKKFEDKDISLEEVEIDEKFLTTV